VPEEASRRRSSQRLWYLQGNCHRAAPSVTAENGPRPTHHPRVAGSNPAPATIMERPGNPGLFHCAQCGYAECNGAPPFRRLRL
jgi:hypothetical protein